MAFLTDKLKPPVGLFITFEIFKYSTFDACHV